MVSYGINAALWSDGADKERYFAIPDGTTIGIGADGDWNFPTGSVLMKTFLLGGKRVETRLFMKHPDGTWAGYSYEWNDAQTDATLLPASKAKAVGAQTWYFPSRAECLICHTTVAGNTLGLETGQMNRDHRYPNGRVRSQLATLDALGFLASALPQSPEKIPDPFGADALESRARAYLHANCSNCHRPNGTGRGPADFRYSTALADANVCNENPSQGTLGIAGAKLVVPGSPSSSILSVRIHALNASRMPPLASRVVDPEGTALIDQWISSLNACP
jgi:uncharacterized repeat protein (TIGR03806 family)